MKRNWLAIPVIIITIALFTTAAAAAIILWGNTDPFSDKFGILLSVVSMVISGVALIYAMITYYSIDRVQAINSMEGNVLCNDKYSVAYPESISRFESCRSKEEFNRRLFDILRYRRAGNCRDYAVRLQCVVDNLIWIAYAEHDDRFYQECGALLDTLERDRKRFKNVNSGLNDVMDENLKLIRYVIEYQNHKIQNTFTMSRLENIRGRLLSNPIAAITYYDYLGLEYMRRARGLLGDNDIFTAEKLCAIAEMLRGTDDTDLRENYRYMLEISEAALKKAAVPAQNDMIWDGYISYNLARVRIMRYLSDPSEEERRGIEADLRSVIRSRKKILYAVWGEGAAEAGKSYLHDRFLREVNSARMLNAAFDGMAV